MRPAAVSLVLLALSIGSYVALTRGSLGRVWVEMNEGRPAPESAAPMPEVRATTAAAGGAAPIEISSAVVTYAVGGRTEAEIFEALLAGGPQDGDRRFFGMTEADMGLQYRMAESVEGCALVDVRVSLAVTTTLPEWDAPSGVAYEVRRDWHRFLSALQRHEAEHKALATRGVQKVYGAVDGLRRPTCAEVEAEARRRLDRIEIEIEASHRRYDDQTGHGRTEGASWPPR